MRTSGAVIVTTPQDVALIDARKGVSMFRKVGIRVRRPATRSLMPPWIVGSVLNMSHFVCSACSTEHPIFGSAQNFERDAQELDIEVLGRVPLDPEASARGDSGRPVVLASEASAAAAALLDVGSRLARKIGL